MTEYRVALIGPDGKIDPSLYDGGGSGIPVDLIDGETGRIRTDLMPLGLLFLEWPGIIPAENLPSNLVKLDVGTQKLPVSIMPFGVSGYPRSVDFALAGTIVERIGLFYWRTPPFAKIKPRAFTVQLGTTPTTTASPLVFGLNANGVEIARITVPNGVAFNTFELFTGLEFSPGTLISVDVLSAPVTGATLAADAVVQFWWEYTD